MLKYIYFGTPEISKDVLSGLTTEYGKPSLIVSSVDMPSGRGLKLVTPPVAQYAKENSIPLLQPNKLKDIKEELEKIGADIAVLFAYGKIIPQWLLDLFPHGIINVHPSLLPLYRGATPLTGPILNGDNVTGITIMDMDSQLDHGDIYLQDKINLDTDTNRIKLEQYVVETAPKLLAQVLNNIKSNVAIKTPQDHSNATHTTKIVKSDGEIKDTDTDEIKYRKYKAYIGWPGTYFYKEINNKSTRIKITNAFMKDGKFIIDTVIPENGKEMAYSNLANNSL